MPGRRLLGTKDGKKSQNDLRKVEKKLRQVQHLRDKKLKGAQLSAEEEARRPGDFMLMGSEFLQLFRAIYDFVKLPSSSLVVLL